MGSNSITHESHRGKEFNHQDLNWEGESYQEGCEIARQEATKRLMKIEESLYQQRPASWKVVGFRQRTLVTRFGEITITRRLYKAKKGRYHFLLDEYLGWLPHQVATPSLQESLVELATEKPFNQVSKNLSKLTAGVLSSSTIYRLLQKTSQVAIEREKEDWGALYERGEASLGERQVLILYSEGDGAWIHLQREEQRHFELKNAIAYEGWEKLSGKEER